MTTKLSPHETIGAAIPALMASELILTDGDLADPLAVCQSAWHAMITGQATRWVALA